MKPKKILWISVASVFVLLCLAFVVPFFIPSTRLNCETNYIDITCGRSRYDRYLLGIKIISKIEETELSKMYRNLVGERPSPVWRRVTTFSPRLQDSPHYRHHVSGYAARILFEALNRTKFTDEAKRTAIINFFNLLEVDDSYGRAREYAFAISELACKESEREGSEIRVEQLPDVPEKE